MDRLKLYKALSRRLIHELALEIDLNYELEDLALLAEWDSAFRMLRKGIEVLEKDGVRPTKTTREIAEKIEKLHSEHFLDTKLTVPEDKEL